MEKEQVLSDALKALKKIAAGGAAGGINGNFYVAMTKKEFVIAVTLQAKDPKGMKVLSQGKAMRKELGNAKFSRGTVEYNGSAFLLRPMAGNMPGGTILQRFKKGGEDKSLNRFLKRMRIAGEETEEQEESAKEKAAFEAEINNPEVTADLEELKLESQMVARDSSTLNAILAQSDDDAAIEEALSKELAAMQRLFPTTGAYLVERDKHRVLRGKTNRSAREEREFTALGEHIAEFDALQERLNEFASHSGFPMGDKGASLPEVMSANLATSLFLQEADLQERLAAKKEDYERLKASLTGQNSTSERYAERVEDRNRIRKEISVLEKHLEALSSEQALDPAVDPELYTKVLTDLKAALGRAYPNHGVNIYGKVLDFNAKASDNSVLTHSGAEGVGAQFSHDGEVKFEIRPLVDAELKTIAEQLFVLLPNPPTDSGAYNAFKSKIDGVAASDDAEDLILSILNYPKSHMAAGLAADDGVQRACEAFLIGDCGSNWFDLKDWLLKNKFPNRVGKPAKPKQYMWQMLMWRDKVTQDKLKALSLETGGVLIVKSVGSKNLTSDIDITLSSSDNSGVEIEVTRVFNSYIQTRLKAMPGVAMDVNCYPKDFLPVKDNQIESGLDDGALETVEILLGRNQKDQDKTSLIKMRQYMSQEQWDSFTQSEGLEGDQTQFSDAENQYFQSIFSLCKETITHYNTRKAADGQPNALPFTADATFEGLMANHGALFQSANPFSGAANAVQAAKEAVQTVYNHVVHHMDEIFMEARYEIYLDKMSTIRGEQKKTRELKAELAQNQDAFLDGLDNSRGDALRKEAQQSHDDFLSGLSADAQKAYLARLAKKSTTVGSQQDQLKFLCDLEIDTRIEASKSALGEANFFAPEAYTSEGPLNHIVLGKQSNNPEVIKKLKPEHFLESINEQTGDFFKDCIHYQDSTAECFYQTSKYLSRMLEGIIKLSEREGFEGAIAAAEGCSAMTGTVQATLSRIESDLVPMRGSKGKWAKEGTEQQRDKEAIAVINSLFGVNEIAAFREKIQQMSVAINIYVRAQLAQ